MRCLRRTSQVDQAGRVIEYLFGSAGGEAGAEGEADAYARGVLKDGAKTAKPWLQCVRAFLSA
eukprot:5690235-Pyramimonas_sp.AAC.1